MLSARDIGKKYNKRWIFRHLELDIHKGSRTAIAGSNGSGKSTLLQILAGYLSPSEGKIEYDNQSDALPSTVFLGPYTEIIEEYTLREFLHFYGAFKEPRIPLEEMAKNAALPLDESIADFSTGMKQRVKLITAFYYACDLICMDEPTANLDQDGFAWWASELEKLKHSTVIIASNQKNELDLCTEMINLQKNDT